MFYLLCNCIYCTISFISLIIVLIFNIVCIILDYNEHRFLLKLFKCYLNDDLPLPEDLIYYLNDKELKIFKSLKKKNMNFRNK